MTIVPANEAAYRLKTRRRLTLDLFTRYGTFWEDVACLREEWATAPVVAVPPEPMWQYGAIPYRFHLPDEPPGSPYLMPTLGISVETYVAVREREPWLRASRLLGHLERLWRLSIPEDIRDGSNAGGWASWITFLSACILYNPPGDRLLEYAEHDDRDAIVHPFPTAWKDSEAAIDAAMDMQQLFKTGDIRHWYRATGAHEASWRPSEAKQMSPGPGNPNRHANPLRDVQCAFMALDGLSVDEIGKRLEVPDYQYADSYGDQRTRSNAVEKAIKRGTKVLSERGYMRLNSE